MSDFPWFSFYAADWLTSLTVSTMNIAQQGAYHRLLCYAWTDHDCGIPDDLNKLHFMTGWNDEKYGSFAPVLACFPPHPTCPGKLANPRLLVECQKVRDLRLLKRNAAQVRWEQIKTVKNTKLAKQAAHKPNGKTAFPQEWKPSPDEFEPWRKFGINPMIEFAAFRDHAKSIDRRLSDWKAGFRNWCRKAIRMKERRSA